MAKRLTSRTPFTQWIAIFSPELMWPMSRPSIRLFVKPMREMSVAQERAHDVSVLLGMQPAKEPKPRAAMMLRVLSAKAPIAKPIHRVRIARARLPIA